ncbi:transferrin receptor protein 2-like, partial [Lampetra fluviatilis]
MDAMVARTVDAASLQAFQRALAATATSDSAQFMFDSLRQMGLHTSVQSHMATVDYVNPSRPNTVRLLGTNGSRSVDIDTGSDTYYSPYSATGSVRGCLVYVNYGRREDFVALGRAAANASGCVALIRDGAVSHAEKVHVAEKFGCVGVLIYPDPADRPNLDEKTAVLAH